MARRSTSARSSRVLRVHILALRDSTALVPIGLVDMLRKAMEVAATIPTARPRPILEPKLVACGPGRLVSGAGGVRVHCDTTIRDVRRTDVVLVPALDPDVVEHLALNRDAVGWVRRMHAAGADVASACTGAFLLGEAGLLDGRAATTHWAFQDLLRRRYPRVRLRPEAIVVDEGRVCTAGGATSFLNLALYLVERWLGPEVARASSKMFLIDPNKSPQTAYAILAGQKTHADADILRAQDFIETDFTRTPSVDELSEKLAMSRRTFVRRFTRATGSSPRDYLQRVRVEAAKRALETSTQPVGAIAVAIGYTDPVAFRKLFVRFTGLTPADYRRRYGVDAPALGSLQRQRHRSAQPRSRMAAGLARSAG
jgi:transcriptional regulator GlxA family with amidase domain